MTKLAPLVGALIVLAGCGSSGGGDALRWTRTPLVYAPPRLPHDRVVVGQVRNASGNTLKLDVRRLVVRDAGGDELVSSARFAAGFAHPLYGAFQQPSFNEPFELTRLGITIRLPPGDTAPLYVAYRLRRGSKPPISADYGAGVLSMPRRPPVSPAPAR